MQLHYGIISCASITDRFLHAILENNDRIEAVSSRSLVKAQAKAHRFHVKKAYGSYEQVYQDPDVNIVYIATNNGTHVEEIKRALCYGKHVVCEKPIALSQQDAKDVFAYAAQQHCFLMEAQKSLFLPVTNDLFNMIQKQTLGKLHQVELSSSFPNPEAAWMHDPTQGGVVYGSASYTIEYLDHLIHPASIQVSALGTKEVCGTYDRISISLLMDDVLINSRISMNGDTKKHAIFYFENGYVEVPLFWKARDYTIHTKGHQKRVLYPCIYEMKYEVSHIHECIQKGYLESPVMSAKRSILCCEIVDEIMSQKNS